MAIRPTPGLYFLHFLRLSALKRSIIKRALLDVDGNRAEAARELDLSPSCFCGLTAFPTYDALRDRDTEISVHRFLCFLHLQTFDFTRAYVAIAGLTVTIAKR